MDPATLIAIIEEVSNAIQKEDERRNFSNWQNEVSGKLTQILAKTEEILQELRKFRIEIEINMDTRFRGYFIAGLQAAISDVSDVLTGVSVHRGPTSEQKKRLLQIADELRNILKQSLAYGYAVLPMSLCGYLTLIPAMRIAGANAAEIEATMNSLRGLVFKPGLDPTREGSFAWALQKTRESRSSSESLLNEAMRPATLAMWWMGAPPLGEGDGMYQAQAAVTTFECRDYYGGMVTATEISVLTLEEPTGTFGPHVNWQNVSPAPAVGIDRRTNSISGARKNRDLLLSKYLEVAQGLPGLRKQEEDLSRFIARTLDVVGPFPLTPLPPLPIQLS